MDTSIVPAVGSGAVGGPTRLSRKVVGAVAAALLLIAWLVRDYRPPRETSAAAVNEGRRFELKSRRDAHGIEQVWVPPGCYERGSSLLDDLRASADETPRHTACVSRGFWLDRTEVTNEAFDKFVRGGGYRERGRWSEAAWAVIRKDELPYDYGFIKTLAGPRHPRVKVTWYEADAYARWRGGRLPTEAEWEWAARGPESQRYPWGPSFDRRLVNGAYDDRRATVPVGSYPGGRSWVGADDMAGNAAEWVADGYDRYAYRSAPRLDPSAPPTGGRHVLKGGAWGGVTGGWAADLRGARRLHWPADSHKTSHGFRVASPE
jgi:formylglycine-generating enzyme required for sulfatase activity